MLRQIVAGGREAEEAPIARLSDRELEVFRLIGAGLGTRQISEDLRISIKTVESYQAHIKEKLELQSSRDLVQRAIEWRMNELNDKKEPADVAYRSMTSGNPRWPP